MFSLIYSQARGSDANGGKASRLDISCHAALLPSFFLSDTSWIPDDILTAIDNDDVNALLELNRHRRKLTIRSRANGQTLLHYAAFKGKSEALLILSSFIRPDVTDHQGRGLLHYAVLNRDHASRIETLYVLIVDLEISVDVIDEYGYVASSYYRSHSRRPFKRPNIPDEQQRTLAQLAIEIGAEEASRQSYIGSESILTWETSYRREQGLFPFNHNHNEEDLTPIIMKVPIQTPTGVRYVYADEFKARVLRELDHGATRIGLARKYGISATVISNWENNRNNP